MSEKKHFYIHGENRATTVLKKRALQRIGGLFDAGPEVRTATDIMNHLGWNYDSLSVHDRWMAIGKFKGALEMIAAIEDDQEREIPNEFVLAAALLHLGDEILTAFDHNIREVLLHASQMLSSLTKETAVDVADWLMREHATRS